MELKKYRVLYSREKIMSYLKNGRVYRSRAGNATDEFVEEFLKYGSEKAHPNFRKMIVKVQAEKPKAPKAPKKDTGEKSERPTEKKTEKPKAKKVKDAPEEK